MLLTTIWFILICLGVFFIGVYLFKNYYGWQENLGVILSVLAVVVFIVGTFYRPPFVKELMVTQENVLYDSTPLMSATLVDDSFTVYVVNQWYGSQYVLNTYVDGIIERVEYPTYNTSLVLNGGSAPYGESYVTRTTCLPPPPLLFLFVTCYEEDSDKVYVLHLPADTSMEYLTP